jgi:hypothetical protein
LPIVILYAQQDAGIGTGRASRFPHPDGVEDMAEVQKSRGRGREPRNECQSGLIVRGRRPPGVSSAVAAQVTQRPELLRQVAGDCPTSFLNARLNAASDS